MALKVVYNFVRLVHVKYTGGKVWLRVGVNRYHHGIVAFYFVKYICTVLQ